MAAPELTDLQTFPLAQIQQAEAVAARQIEEAQAAACATVNQARLVSDQVKRDAVDEGRREGEVLYAQVVAEAQLEAGRILNEARDRLDRVNSDSQHMVDLMASRAVAVVIGDGEAARS